MADSEEFERGSAARRPVACVGESELDAIDAHVQRGAFVWLHMCDATDEQLDQAGSALGLHPLTTEDLQEFSQRAKVEEFDEYVYIVAYGATSAPNVDGLVEIHLVYGPDSLFTVSAQTLPDLEELHENAGSRSFKGNELLHAVLDLLVDSYGPLLDDLDSEIEALEERVIDRDLRGRELDIHNVRRSLARVSRVMHRQSESFTRLPEALRRLPDHDPANAPYFRDIQDHLIRVCDAADGMRDRVAGVFELYLAALDNRQNVIMKQFTVIAGIFLPLSVVTGFFGMNFGWMVEEIDTRTEFLAYGVSIPIVILVALLLIIRSRGLFED
ncbi:MAG: magnesium transporter CorA family protein [Solirubrobacterales bacterium]